MQRIMLAVGIVLMVGILAFAQQEAAKQSNAERGGRKMFSNLHMGEWLHFENGERGLILEVLPKSDELTIDAWYEQWDKLLAEKSPFEEARYPVSVDRSQTEEEVQEVQKAARAKREEAQKKVDEINIRIGALGRRPYEVIGIHDDHIVIRSSSAEFYLAASSIRYVKRPRK